MRTAPFFRSETSAAPGDRFLLLSTHFPPRQAPDILFDAIDRSVGRVGRGPR